MNAYEPGTTPQSFGKTLRVAKRGSLLIVALNRPNVKNAMNDEVYGDLTEILRYSTHTEAIAGVILTGVGSYFSSGADLKSGSFEIEPKGRRTLIKPAGEFMMAVLQFPKLLCAAVNGPAVGIGATLLLHCDLVFCSKEASFWAPFARLALVPEFASSISLRHCMGLSKANELLLLGKRLTAKEMVEWNIASRVVNISSLQDPFQGTSLASNLAALLEKSLLSLPCGTQTAQYFAKLVGSTRRDELKEVCLHELQHLDERFDNGHVQKAASKLKIGRRSRL